MKKPTELKGAGIGLRRGLMTPFLSEIAQTGRLGDVQFMEVAPENWITVGGQSKKDFYQLAERFPMALHGLSLSIGGPDPLNETLVKQVKTFKADIQSPLYSEHLSYCTDGGQLYDLMPIPFTEAAVEYVVERVMRVQDILGERMALEHVSYYLTQPGAEMTEIEFINAVIKKADCYLHLDVNNIYVNAINHQYDPIEFLDQLPLDRLVYIHIAGHYEEAEDLKVDTHGSDVKTEVWDLLAHTYRQAGVFPTLLERDFNFPPVSGLLKEVAQISYCQQPLKNQDAQQTRL